MNGKQEAVMWSGLLLIAVRLFTTSQGADIWKMILKGATKSSGGPSVIPPPGPLLPEIPEIPLISDPKGPSPQTNGGSMSV